MLGRLRLSFDEVWAFLAVGLPALAGLLAPMSMVDLGYAIRAGQLMLGSGSVLRSDPFTFTAAGSAWLDQQWAAQVLLALVYDSGGWLGLALVRAVLIGLAFGLVFVACRLVGASTRSASLLTLAGFLVAAATLALRAQLFGILCFALATVALAARDRWPRAVWVVPVVTLAWANLHGSFVLGPAMLAIALLADVLARRPRARVTAVAFVASLVGSVLTPFGPAVWSYALDLSVDSRIRHLVTEWQPSTPLSFEGAAFYASVILLGAAAAWVARRHRWRLDLPTVLWLLALGLLGVLAARGVAWWALGAPVVAAGLMARAMRPMQPRDLSHPPSRAPLRRSYANGIIVLGVVLAAVLVLPLWRGRAMTPPAFMADVPTGLTATLSATATPADRLFAAQPWASWFELAVPGVPVFADSRVEVVPSTVWDDYLAISRADAGWSARLDGWGVTILAVSHADQPALLAAASRETGWQTIASDEEGAVFVRRGRRP